MLGLEDEDDDGNEASGLVKKPFKTEKSLPVIRQDETMKNVCHCGLEAKRVQTKKAGPNQNRWFLTCPKAYADKTKCDFFEWEDLGDENTNYEGDRKLDYNQDTGELL